MKLNAGQLLALERLNIAGGIATFRSSLGQIFLPPDPQQHPSPEFIQRANRFSQIST